MSIEQIIFIAMVFIAVFLLAGSVIVPTMGTDARAAKLLRARVNDVMDAFDPGTASLLREKYLRKLSPLERWIETLPGMERLGVLIEQAGSKTSAYKLVLAMFGLGISAGVIVMLWSRQPLFGLITLVIVASLPLLKLRRDCNKRLIRFEEQLPDALGTMTRALRAGHPFAETLRLVGDEMSDPIGKEFRTVFSDINYGMSVKVTFLSLLKRIPSVSLMAMVTAVMVQRDTGGNMAEILDKLAAVVRGRFRFERKVRTLSAEGRLSAWILCLIPFGLAVAIAISSPEYLPLLTKDPLGRKLIVIAFITMIVGIFWIRRLIRIQV